MSHTCFKLNFDINLRSYHYRFYSKILVWGHISTFGGHPVSCAASLATIQTIQEEQLLDKVDQKANLFKTELTQKWTMGKLLNLKI